MPEIQNIREYEPLLRQVIEKHSPEAVEFLFVESVAQWSRQHGGSDKVDPPAMAIRDRETHAAGIVFRLEIDDDQVESIKQRMEFGECGELGKRLTTPDLFLTHLVLHELAHLLNDWDQEHEDECDAWAFEKMGWLSSSEGDCAR